MGRGLFFMGYDHMAQIIKERTPYPITTPIKFSPTLNQENVGPGSEVSQLHPNHITT